MGKRKLSKEKDGVNIFVQRIISGDVNRTMQESKTFSSLDEFAYCWENKIYDDILELYQVLLEQKRYDVLKDFNECQCIIERVKGISHGRKSFPMYLQIEHSSYCNARCIMCPHYYLGNEGADQLEYEIFEKIKEWLPFVRMVGLHGFGEPFLANNLLLYLKEYRNYGIKFYMNTNLSVLPKGIEEYYPSFEFINISCDGATKEVFEQIRCGLKFDVFVENVKNLREKARGIRLVMAVVLMRQNLNQCRDFVVLAKRLGFDEIMFSKIGINYVVGNYEDSVDKYPTVFRVKLKEAVETGIKLGIKVTVPVELSELQMPVDMEMYEQEYSVMTGLPFWSYSQDILRREYDKRKCHDIPLEFPIMEKCYRNTSIRIEGVCDWLSNNIYIGASGKVGFCCSNARYYIGDLKNQSLEEIWNCRAYERMIACFQKGYLPDYCKYCNLLAKQILQNVHLI